MKNSPLEKSVSALLIGEFKKDRLLVHEVFQPLGWRLFEARNRRQAMRCLVRNPVQVVLAEAELPRWSWKKVLGDLRSLAPVPQLIVVSRTADDFLWSEALNFGAYDVLAQPLVRDELERVIASARRHFDVRPERAKQAAAAAIAQTA
jgi:DNA-binding NtrC family response regulator